MVMDLRTWIIIVIILILLGVLFYLRTKKQEGVSQTEIVEEAEPMTMDGEESTPEMPEEDGTEEERRE